MEKKVLFKSFCNRLEVIIESLSLSFDVKEFQGLVRGYRFYDVYNAPRFSDFFLGSELRTLVNYCSKYKEVDYCIMQRGEKVCFCISVPFDL